MTRAICFITAIGITSRHCAGKFQPGLQTRADVELQSARIRLNKPRETCFKHYENCKINRRCSVCAADGANRFCLLLPVNRALAVARSDWRAGVSSLTNGQRCAEITATCVESLDKQEPNNYHK